MKKLNIRLKKLKLLPKPKLYTGNFPENATLIAGTVHGWRLYERHTGQNDWANFKLVWRGKRPKKANYWLAIRLGTGKISNSKDSKILAEHEPKIFAWVEKVMLNRIKTK